MKQKFQILALTLALLQTGTIAVNAANITITPTTSGGISGALTNMVDGDTLTLQPGTYTLNSNVPTVGLSIDKNITIQSSDSSQNAIIDLNGFSRAFNVASDGNLTLINITIINGHSMSDGGAIFNNGNVTLFGCTFMNNSADNSGGAIDNYCGNLNLIDCIFIGNTAQLSGGAVSNRGLIPTNIANLTAKSCIFLNNRASMGNTIYNVNNANLSVSFSVFYNNTDLGILNYNDGLSGAFKDNFYFWINPDLNNPTNMATLLESICRNHDVVDGFYYLDFTTNTVSCVGDTLKINSLSYTGSVDNRDSLPDLNIVLNYNGDTVAYYNYKNETKIELESLVNDFSFYYEDSLLYQLSINVTAANFSTGGNNYATLEDATAAVADGGVITMLQDVTTANATLSEDKTYTLDLNGYTLTDNTTYWALHITAGTVTVKNGAIANTFDDGIYLSGGAAILDNLTINAVSYALYVEDGNVSVLSGEYVGGDGVSCVNNAIITITEGHFVRTGEGGCLNENGGQILLADGSTANVDPWKNDANAKDVTISAATNGISTAVVGNMQKVAGYYSIMGQKLSQEPQNGIYIILYDNGKAEKKLKTKN